MGGLAEMSDSWIDFVDQGSRQDHGRRPRAVTVMLAAVAVVIVLAVIVWLRFLSGASSASVPASVDDVPAIAASSTATTSSVVPGGRVASAAVHQQAVTTTVPQLTSSSSTEPRVDAAWLDSAAAATGISRRALQAYAGAELELEREQPSCHLGWNTLAAIGKIESNNGRVLTDAGYSTTPILGPAVEGGQHADGPMQFMPGTWAKWGADGNGDGVDDPNQIDDAALAAARYLCSYGQLDTAAGWHAAVFGYNHLDSYVAAVAAQATQYAQSAAGIDGRS
jgi:membrane-bound lytic murein transglycosylase B